MGHIYFLCGSRYELQGLHNSGRLGKRAGIKKWNKIKSSLYVLAALCDNSSTQNSR
jgi:hypothetical protein